MKSFFVALLLCGSLFGQPREGGFVGVGGGAALDRSKLKAVNLTNGFALDRKLDHTNAIGSVFAGYGRTFINCFFLGLEGGTYFPSRRASGERRGVFLTSSRFSNILRVHDYFTGDILIGTRACCDLLFFLRAGFNIFHLHLAQKANELAGVPRFTNNVTKCGGRVGLGFSYTYWCNWSIGVDYIHSFSLVSRLPSLAFLH